MAMKLGPELEIRETDLDIPIFQLIKDRLPEDVIRDIGAVKVNIAEYKDNFFQKFVQQPLESGKFGKLLYGQDHILKTKISTTENGWVISQAYCGEYASRPIKELFAELKKQWEAVDPTLRENLKDPEYAFQHIEEWIRESDIKYPESYDEQTVPSPFEGIEMVGDLKLPFDLYKIEPKLEEVFHNYLQAPGITSPWTYLFGPKSNTLFHFEDALLSSTNLNCGPGTKYWAVVPRKEFFKLLAFYSNNRPEKCGHEFSNKRLAPTIQQLIDFGIEVIFFAQKAGELMFLDGAVLHQVMNIEYGISVSKNVLTESWLEYGPIGLWFRRQCHNSLPTAFGNELFKDVTIRFDNLANRMKCTSVTKCVALDKEMLKYMETGWTPLQKEFAERFRAVRQGECVNLRNPQNSILRKTLTLYSDIKGLTRFYPDDKEDIPYEREERKLVPVKGQPHTYRLRERKKK